VLLLQALIAMSQVQEVPVKGSDIGSAIIDRKVSTVFQIGTRLTLWDLKSGEEKELSFQLGWSKRYHRMVARGTGQQSAAAIGITHNDRRAMAFDLSVLLDADGPNRVLTWGGSRMWPSKAIERVLIEARFDKKNWQENGFWRVLDKPGYERAVVAARFNGSSHVLAWFLEGSAARRWLRCYRGDRAHPNRGLARISSIETPVQPADRMVYLPELKAFIREDWLKQQAHLVSVTGKSLKQVGIYQSDGHRTDRDLVLQEIWDLTVPESSVPKGKQAWIPVASTADRREWLLRSASNSKHYLLRASKTP
jgi:hypothetical protein